MQNLIQQLIIRWIIRPVDATAQGVIDTASTAAKIVVGFFTLLLIAICLFLIDWQVYPVMPALVIFFVILISGIISVIRKTSPGAATILSSTLLTAILFLVLTVYFPGWKSTIASLKHKFDNSSFNSYAQAQELREKIQNKQKQKEDPIAKKIDSLLAAGNDAEALKLYGDYYGSTEVLKYKIDSIESSKVTKEFSKSKNNVDKPTNTSDNNQKLVAKQPVIKKIGKNKVHIYFTSDAGIIKTGLSTKPGQTLVFSKVTAPFRMPGESEPYYPISSGSAGIEWDVKNYGNLNIYSAGYDGEVTIELKD